MSVPAEVLVERLCEAAHVVGRARHVLPPDPDWEYWHQLLWQIQWVLNNAAEQIHAEQACHELAQTRWQHAFGSAQGWTR
jgi:hypothetical protein